LAYRVVIDPSSCIGTSQCTEVAPEAYEMNGAHTLSLLRPRPSDAAMLLGAKSCPVGAITVFDGDGKQIWP
jgi:ferredoxin